MNSELQEVSGEVQVVGGGRTMKIGIIACGAIVREMIAVARRQDWDFELTAVPAQYHMEPERIAPAVAREIDAWAGCFDLILVGYADCGTAGALDALLDRYDHVARIPGPHCYEFYGGQTFDRQADENPGTFYLTDFLARHFDGLVWRGLWLDRYPELRDDYFGNYTHLLYLQQAADTDESDRARDAAKRLDLEYVQVETGLDELERRLVAIVEARRQVLEKSDALSSPASSAASSPAFSPAS